MNSQNRLRNGILAAAAVLCLVVLLLQMRSCGTASDANVPQKAAQEQAAEDAEDQASAGDTAEAGKTDSVKSAEAEKDAGDAEEENPHSADGMCTITIHNGAASANTTEAVNGLHVYDPDSEELEDYISGAEVPIGTKVTVYVYNLASPVSLKVEHNGEMAAERTYPLREAFVEDETVEFLEYTLEGDLNVTTEVIKASEVKSELSGGTLNKDGSKRETDGANSSGSGDAKKAGKKDPKNKASESRSSYTITLSNAVSASDAAMTVGYINESEQPVNVSSGNSYPNGLYVGARALNYSTTRSLRLSARTSSGAAIDSVTVSPAKGSTPGANGFYITLSDDTVFTLSYADQKEPEIKKKSKESQKKSSKTGKKKSKTKNKKSTTKQTPTPTPTLRPTATPAPHKPGVKYFKVTVENGAASANTTQYVNGLHVYDLSDPDLDDINGTAELPEGTEIRIYAYPLAGDIHMLAVHNGKTIVDSDILRMVAFEDDDKIQFFNVKLSGDLTVRTKAGKGPFATPTPANPSPTPVPTEEPEPTESPSAEPTETPTPTEGASDLSPVPTETAAEPTATPTEAPTPEPKKKYTVNVEDKTGGSGYSFTVGYADSSDNQVVIRNGDQVEEGTVVGAAVNNKDGKDRLILDQLGADGKVQQSFEIAAGGAGGIYVQKSMTEGVHENISFVLRKA